MSRVRGAGMSAEYSIQGGVEPHEFPSIRPRDHGKRGPRRGPLARGDRRLLSPRALAHLCRQLAAGIDGGADQARSRAHRRAHGAYFTPVPLVELVVAEALGARLARRPPAWRDDGSPELIV